MTTQTLSQSKTKGKAVTVAVGSALPAFPDIALIAARFNQFRDGIRAGDHSRCIVTQRHPASGVTTYEYIPRAFLLYDLVTLENGSRVEFAPRALDFPRKYRSGDHPFVASHLDTVRLAVFIPGHGFFVTDADILPAARRAAERFFPNAKIATPRDINTVYDALAKKFSWGLE